MFRPSLFAFAVISAIGGFAAPLFAFDDASKDKVSAGAANLYEGFDGYSRKVTTDSAEAQKWFNQGIQLLYGYNHDEAIRSFEKAAEIDPSCAMAWWGSAYARGLHINNPEMGEEQSRLAYEAAQKALNALDDETPVEQALVHAVSKRYAMPVPEDRSSLDQAYADAMEQAWHQFPEDADVGALFAESLMTLQPWDLWTDRGEPKGRIFEILAALEKTMSHTPMHPGANHFYIHAIEASPWPEQGTDAAERLKGLVPGSGHLVHMPSHIFIRTGRYADAADANSRAIAAARKLEQQIPPEFLKNYVTIADGFMPTSLHVMIRFGKWEDILAEPEPEEWRLFSRAERHFARSVAYASLNETEKAREELALLDEISAEITDDWKMGNNPASDVLAIAHLMAEGEIFFFDGEPELAFDSLRQAVALEEKLSYDEPPGWMQPVRHALGALLLADGRPAEAEAVYRADLKRHPHNAWSLLGLQQSLRNQRRLDEAEEMDEEVKAAWARADVKPIASCLCHPDARR